ncbi:hypothetical protein FDK32_23415 [Citrobacter freundii]|nr:hypothetical protein [Citrobacter freundii]
MGSCAAPSAKGDDKFITTDYLQQCRTKCLIRPTTGNNSRVRACPHPVFFYINPNNCGTNREICGI